MQLHSSEIAPAMRNPGRNAAETQNERNMVQRRLMSRYPSGDLEWALRFNAAYRELFNEDGFYDQVREAHLAEDYSETENALLTRIQERLETMIEARPDLVEGAGKIEDEIAKYLPKNGMDQAA